MSGTGFMKDEDNDQMREAGDVFEPGGIGRVDLDFAPDIGEASRPPVPARVDVITRFERRMDDTDGPEPDHLLT